LPHARAHIQSAVATAQQVLNDPNNRDGLSAIDPAAFTLINVLDVLPPFSDDEMAAIDKLSDGNKQKIAYAIKLAVDRNHALNVSWHPSSGTQLVSVTPAATIDEGTENGVVSILIRTRYDEDRLGSTSPSGLGEQQQSS
jgi:hypothetical protein